MSSNNYKGTEQKSIFISVIVGAYVLLVGIGLPLVIRDFYYDILIFKYYYYCFCTITMIILLFIFSVVNAIKAKRVFKLRAGIKSLICRCTKLDLVIFSYWIIALISTLTSNYKYESFWGNEGRYTGFFLITWYVLAYFCVSRFWKYKSFYIDLILLSGIIVCIFGITDYFNLDVFHFKALLLPNQRAIFTSTIGNINTYTAYVGIIVGISSILFVTERRLFKKSWYYICFVISLFAIIMGVSDNAYLSLAALFGFSPLYLFKVKSGVKKYLIIIATFFSVAQCIDWINTSLSNKVIGVDGIFNLVINSNILSYLVISLWLIIVVWYLYDRFLAIEQKNYGKKLVYIWLSFVAIIFMGILFVLYDCNFAGNTDKYGFARNYIFFTDDWGTHRGYIWRNALECFMDLSFMKKIIGYGPETFGILLIRKTADNPYKEIFDSAHNEYLQILITMGIAGLTTYIAALIIFLKNCLKNNQENTYVVAIAFGVICYSTQAFVNLNIPIVAPIIWLLLGMGSAKSLNNMKN